MKKNEAKKLKKLRLSRETLKTLASSDIRKAVGASVEGISCPSHVGCTDGGGGACPDTVGPTAVC